MEINFSSQGKGKREIEVGDLVRHKSTHDSNSYVMLVVEDDLNYNLVNFSNRFFESKIGLSYVEPITKEKLQDEYILVAKSEDVKINLEF